jgi:hypothetical protein
MRKPPPETLSPLAAEELKRSPDIASAADGPWLQAPGGLTLAVCVILPVIQDEASTTILLGPAPCDCCRHWLHCSITGDACLAFNRGFPSIIICDPIIMGTIDQLP